MTSNATSGSRSSTLEIWRGRFVQDTARPFPDLRADCLDFQTKLEADLESGLPLATLPSEWLLAHFGRRFYRKINRDWLTCSIRTDGRFFVFSNLGIIDSDFKPALPYHRAGVATHALRLADRRAALFVLFSVLGGEGH